MTEKKYDVAILGGGPGGYPAAIKLAQNGKKVALIEALALGGTCLNRGCIPSKALISNAEALHTIKNAKEFCIEAKGADFNFAAMIEQKNGIVNKLKTSLEGLIQANKIDVFQGFGKFMSRSEMKVMGKDNVFLKADNIIIATGSEPKEIKAFPF